MNGSLVAGLQLQDIFWHMHSPSNLLRLGKGELIDVDGRQAPGQDLRGLNWEQIKSAKGANFSGSNFNGVSLGQTSSTSKFDFSRANLSEASFVKAFFPLNGTSFVQANLTNADFTGARLRKPDFTGANLLNALFVSSKAPTDPRMRGILDSLDHLKGGRRRADLRGARFNQADLRGADFTDAILRRAIFVACTGNDFRQNNNKKGEFSATKLDKADLRGARFDRQDMSFFSLNGADIRGADFTNATNMTAIRTAKGVVYSPPGFGNEPTQFPPGFIPPDHWIALSND